MRLGLAEQLLLLALDDDRGHTTTHWAGDQGLAAALLLDLGHRDLLRVDGHHLAALPGAEPDDELLAACYRLVRDSTEPRRAKDWVGRLPRELASLRDRVARGLVAGGVLTEQRSRFLGIFPTTRFPEADPAPEAELRARLIDVLVTGRTPTEEEALLIGLIEPLGLVDRVVGKEHRRAARARAAEIGVQGVAGTAMRDVVRELQTTVVMTAVLVPMITSSGSG